MVAYIIVFRLSKYAIIMLRVLNSAYIFILWFNKISSLSFALIIHQHDCKGIYDRFLESLHFAACSYTTVFTESHTDNGKGPGSLQLTPNMFE